MRIASLSPAVTEILFSFGIGNQIVCTDQFSNFPEDAKHIPHLRDHVKIDPKDLAEHKVDLVFTCTSIQTKLCESLRTAGYSVIHEDPRTVHEIYAFIRNVGVVVGCEKRAEELVLTMQREFNGVKEKAVHLPRHPRVYIEEWNNPPYASGNWVPEVARMAGCQQFPVEPRALSPQVSLEQVMAHDPDFIVLSLCGAGDRIEKKIITERPGWEELRAIREGKVRIIDDSLLNRPGPRLTEGARRLYGWAFELLH